mgnify:FL=1
MRVKDSSRLELKIFEHFSLKGTNDQDWFRIFA